MLKTFQHKQHIDPAAEVGTTRHKLVTFEQRDLWCDIEEEEEEGTRNTIYTSVTTSFKTCWMNNKQVK